MNVTHQFTTDLQTRDTTERIHAMQGDGGTRVVEVTLLEGGKAWSPAGVTASVAFRNLKDGHKGWYDKLPSGDDACKISGNVVTATLAPAVLSGDGEVQAAIVFQDAQLNQLATFGFSILVEKNPAAGSDIHNDYYAYSTMEAVSEAVDAMLDSLENTKAQLGQLVGQVNTAVAQVLQEAGPAIVCEAYGEVIAVSDAADRTLQGLTICGKTVQNGTPSPSNPVPLVNVGNGGSIGVQVCGRNIARQIEGGGNATISGNAVTFGPQGDSYFFVTPYGIPGGTVVTLSFDAGAFSGTFVLAPYNEETHAKEVVPNSRNSFTFQYWPQYHGGKILMDDGIRTAENVTLSNIQLEAGDVPTAYAPSTVQNISLPTPNGLPGIPVASGGNYTDESGQAWVCDEISLAGGVYVQRVKQVALNGSEDRWFADSGYAHYYTYRPMDARSELGKSLCDSYEASATQNPIENLKYWGQNSYYGLKSFTFRNDGIADLASWKAHLAQNPITLIYQLENPVETPLAADTLAAYAALHSSKPNTVVFNDAGAGQKLAYVADTKLYIDRKFTEVTNAIIASGANI